jgi:hypothetical protein
MGVGWPPSSFPLGGRGGAAILAATGGVLEVFPSLGVFLQAMVRV